MQEEKSFVIKRFTEQGDYAFLPEGVLEEMVDKIMLANEAFMEKSGVNEGAAYDDEAACDALHRDMSEVFAEYKMYMLRFTEDYLDYFEEYLESTGSIEWD